MTLTPPMTATTKPLRICDSSHAMAVLTRCSRPKTPSTDSGGTFMAYDRSRSRSPGPAVSRLHCAAPTDRQTGLGSTGRRALHGSAVRGRKIRRSGRPGRAEALIAEERVPAWAQEADRSGRPAWWTARPPAGSCSAISKRAPLRGRPRGSEIVLCRSLAGAGWRPKAAVTSPRLRFPSRSV